MMKYLSNVNILSDLKSYDIDDMRELCVELRSEIIDAVLNCGGHLASSLGAVELIVALHYVFDFPNDKLIFDVGHQSYAHKLLTGRAENFSKNLRKLDGIGGFTKRSESEYDTFTAGHAGNSISLALGLSRARDIAGGNYEVVSVIGDSSIVNGMSFEAMNDAGNKPSKHIIVLNDNAMSISKAVGAVSSKLTDLRQSTYYKKFKNSVVKNLSEEGRKDLDYRALRKIKNGIKYMFSTGILFEEFGYTYVGPIDGHNIQELVKAFEIAKSESGSVIVHVVTKKGKGCIEAEKNPENYHGVGSMYSTKQGKSSYSSLFGDKILELSQKDDKIVAVCPAMPDGTGLKKFSEQNPSRFFDCGIAEEHAVALSAGLARGGMKPYLAIYSTFLQRGFDQIIHDVALQNLPVRICVDRAGFVGEDGETHQGIFDMSFLTAVPNISVVSPASFKEFESILEWSLDVDFPIAIRYPRGGRDNPQFENFSYGKWSVSGNIDSDICLIASGANMVNEALKAREFLENDGRSCCVVNASTIKPLDFNLLDRISKKTLVVLEDNLYRGGLCSSILEYYAKNNKSVKILPFAVEDSFVCQGSVSELYEKYGINAKEIVEKIQKFYSNI